MADQNQDNDDRITIIDPISGDKVEYSTGQKPTSSTNSPNATPGYNTQTKQSTSFRRKNPLGELSSYTYQISLYVLTPECLNQYAATGTLDPNGYFLIAQSGGLNDKNPRFITSTKDIGPNRPGLDYYIDDFVVTTFLPYVETSAASVGTNISFKIVEPTGFKLLNNMGESCKALNQISPILRNTKAKPTLFQQKYFIATRFYGYDVDGNPIATASTNSNQSLLGDSFALYEKIWPLSVTRVTFKIGTGGATVYNWSCGLQSYIDSSQTKMDVIINNATFSGKNVGDALGLSSTSTTTTNKNSLMSLLNYIQRDLKTDGYIRIPNEYAIEFLDQKIPSAKLLLTREQILETTNTSSATNTSQVNVATAARSDSIDTNTRTIPIAGGSKIINIIDQVIASSTYVSDALSVVNQSNVEKESETNDNPNVLNWYIIHPVVEVLNRDPALRDWAYRITYQIAPYSVPYLRTPIVENKKVYYGPVKKYEFLFTGKNTDIISFEQEYQNLYHLINTTTTNKDTSNDTPVAGNETPIYVASATPGSTSSTQIRGGGEKNIDVKTSIADPTAQATATLRIIGDPDYLMSNIGVRLNSKQIQSLASKDLTINPLAGQIFIEIKMITAEDYDDTTGLANNQKEGVVNFYGEDAFNKLGIDSIIYTIVNVESIFSRGRFEQVLTLNLILPATITTPKQLSDEARNRPANSGSAPQQTNSDSAGATNDARLPQIPPLYQLLQPVSESDVTQRISNPALSNTLLGNNRTPLSIPTNTGTVADDESTAGQSYGRLTPIRNRITDGSERIIAPNVDTNAGRNPDEYGP